MELWQILMLVYLAIFIAAFVYHFKHNKKL